MHKIHLTIRATRATTRSPKDLDEMFYIEQIKPEIERVLKARSFYKISIDVKGEAG